MRSRDSLLFGGAFVLLAIASFALFGDPTVAGDLDPSELPLAAVTPEVPSHGDEPGTAAGGAVRPSDVAVADPVFQPSRGRNTTDWTSGVIAGDIPLTPSVVDKLQTIAVVVDELKNPEAAATPPFRKVVAVKLGVGTPTFEVDGIPFSDYGYVVRVHAPGLNGGQATVSITKDNPYVDDVKLPITPGSPFSVLLRDQDRGVLANVELRLVPHLDPPGRPTQFATSDNYGSAVFENVLAGEYRLHVGSQTMPLMQPTAVHVQPGAYQRQGSVVLPQGTTVIVPRGMPVVATVMQPGGWALPGALVQARSTDRRHVHELEGRSDVRGQVKFENLLPGQWEIEVSLSGFERRLVQFTVEEGKEVPEQRFEMARL